ncbi:MAG TPA: glycosyltransferase family 4 protein [Candidatus Dormibacteraeota bacterium]|nr:glycosyltransferase family 4 protein [Candidatus Dormibacteraeota bacterium]
MIRQGAIALLGRADIPTDGVKEYCRHLREALREQGISLAIERVVWAERGWRRALRSLRRHARGWYGTWVLVQYTALAWSGRGFPVRFSRVLHILKAAGARIGVVYHDVEPFTGPRFIDYARRRAQLHAMRRAMDLCDVAVFTVPMEKLSWMQPHYNHSTFIPVGANLPIAGEAASRESISSDGKLRIVVFGVTGGDFLQREVGEIAEAVRFAASRVKNLRLTVLGRHSKDAETELRRRLEGVSVEIQVLGLLSNEDVVGSLSSCDVLLFVRGPISTRRGSAIAGIACGLPVIAAEGPETSSLIKDAGVAFYSPQKKNDLGEVLLHVLQDEHYRASLAQRSWIAQQRYFSWNVIAARYAEFLKKKDLILMIPCVAQ